MGTLAQVHPALQGTFWNMLNLHSFVLSRLLGKALGKGGRQRHQQSLLEWSAIEPGTVVPRSSVLPECALGLGSFWASLFGQL